MIGGSQNSLLIIEFQCTHSVSLLPHLTLSILVSLLRHQQSVNPSKGFPSRLRSLFGLRNGKGGESDTQDFVEDEDSTKVRTITVVEERDEEEVEVRRKFDFSIKSECSENVENQENYDSVLVSVVV